MSKITLVSTVVAPVFADGRLVMSAVTPSDLPALLSAVKDNYCGHPITDAVLRAIYPELPEPVRAFWNGEGIALAVRPKGGVRQAQAEGDTVVSINDIEAVLFVWEPTA